MKNIFSQSFDIVDYVSNNEFEKLAEFAPVISDGAKAFNIDNPEHNQDQDYAIILHHPTLGSMKKYACYSPEITELNLVCLADKINSLPDEIVKIAATNLTAAAKKFKLSVPDNLVKFASSKFIQRDLTLSGVDDKKYIDKLASQNVTPEVHEVYALYDRFPIHTPEHTKKTISWFEKNAHNLDVSETIEFVVKTTAAAVEQGINLESTELKKYAGLNTNTFNSDFYDLVNIRKNNIPEDRDDLITAYNDILRKADELGPEKVAYTLEYLDKEAGINYKYVPDPLLTVFGIEKEASITIDGEQITSKMLKKIKKEDLTDLVGTDGIKELRGKDGLAVFASLPAPIRQDIITLINAQR